MRTFCEFLALLPRILDQEHRDFCNQSEHTYANTIVLLLLLLANSVFTFRGSEIIVVNFPLIVVSS